MVKHSTVMRHLRFELAVQGDNALWHVPGGQYGLE